MDTLDVISTVIALPTLAISALAYAELWQRKEYRWDRLRAYLLSPESRELILPYAIAAFITLLGAVTAKYEENTLPQILGWLGLLVFTFHQGLRTYRRGVFRPVATAKAILLVMTVIVATITYRWFVFKPSWPDVLDVTSLLTFLPLLSAVSVMIVNVPSTIRKRQIIQQAARLRQRLPYLTVIGITGSYGKTSTKHFLMQLLPHVQATSNHRNSEIAVAQDMLKQLNKESKVYIVEMGAYRKGEIAALAKLTRPKMVIMTAIGNQHLALFGSQEKILAAKWELVEALLPDGTVIINGDDPLLRKQGESQSIKKIWYSRTKPADIYVSNAHINPQDITCALHIKNDIRPVKIPLASEGLLQNVLAAVSAAHAVGIESTTLFEYIQQLKPFPRTMEILSGNNNAIVIDDSYSANEHGVLNAVKHVERFPQRDKRIVLLPLIELGKEAPKVHERIGEALAKTEAAIYISGTAFKESLLKGAHNIDPEVQFNFITNPQELASRAGENLTSDTVILLEGRIPAIVRKSLFNSNMSNRGWRV